MPTAAARRRLWAGRVPALVLAVFAPCVAGGAGLPLDLAAWVEPGPEATIHVRATNGTPEPAHAATPTVVFRHRTTAGDSVELAPGATHEWSITLPETPSAGSFPATIRVRHTTPAGESASAVAITLVTAPGAPPDGVRATFTVDPVTRFGAGRVVLETTGPEPVAGRVFFALPGGLSTDPESQPATVARGAPTFVDLVVENHGAPPSHTYSAYAVLQYDAGGVPQSTVARAEVTVLAGGARHGAVPLVVGGAALVVAIAVLVAALRRSAKRRPVVLS
jgi:hypothetical protein